MKKLLFACFSIALLLLTSCKASSTPGQYHGEMSKQKPCAQGCK